MLPANEWNSQQQWLQTQLVEPALVAHARGAEPQVRVSLRITIDQGRDAKFLREALQLARRRGALVQINEVSLDPPLSEKAQRLARVGALLHAEDLNFHYRPALMSSRKRGSSA